MKHLLTLVMGLIFLAGLQQETFGQDQLKIGVLDMQKLQAMSKSFQTLRSDILQKGEALQKELDKEKDEVAALEEELNKQNMMLSLEAKEDKENLLAKKRRHYRFTYDEFMQEMKNEELAATKAIGKEIEAIVDAIGKRDGYSIIFEKRASALVFIDNALDITAEVVEIYDKKKK